jgi:hypothetical protein
MIKSRRIRQASHVAHVGNEESLHQKTERKSPIERPRLRWEDNIKMDLRNRSRRCGLNSCD